MFGDTPGATVKQSTPAANAPTATVPLVGPSAAQVMGQSKASKMVPWVLLALGVLYFAWAWLEEHQKINKAINPQNIRMNLLNLAKIALAVIVSIGFLKIGFAKLAAWHVPGAALAVRIVSIV